MNNAVRILLMSALLLFGGGLLLYHYGAELNIATDQQDPMLWEQSAGDIWLYAGGLMMLFSGSLLLASAKVWLRRRKASQFSLGDLRELKE